MRTQVVDSTTEARTLGGSFLVYLLKKLALPQVFLLIVFVLFCTGCNGGSSALFTDYSLAPYGTPVDGDPLLAGGWRSDSESIEFIPTGVNEYEVRGSRDIAAATLFRVENH